MRCPNCGNELDEDNYCDECMQFMDDSDLDCNDDSYSGDESFGFEEADYDSMINNGDEICLNCTFCP